MEQRKKNSSLWYFAGLALLMLLAFLVIFTGPAFARYRSGDSENLQFAVREPEQICFGTETESGFEPFTSESELVWNTDSEGMATLEITVANGSSRTVYSTKDQRVSVRLIGSLGFLSGNEIAKITLKDESGKTIEATAALISEGTQYYNSVGGGWVFTFSENQEEYYQVLKGGKFSAVTFVIAVDTSAINDITMLQLQAVAEVIK